MGRTEKYRDHCKCIDKDIEVNVIHIEEKGIEVMLSKTCNTVNPKEPINHCKFENSDECIRKNYN